MFTGRRHPGEDALVRWYMADRGLEALEPKDEPVVRHVSSCDTCAARYESVCLDLDNAAVAVVEAADAVFTPDRLLQQRERILRRIDNQGARVIPFPTAESATRQSSGARPLMRWIAVAAAAGLFVGLATGRMLDLGRDNVPSAQQTVVSRAVPTAGNTQVRPAAFRASDVDDALLSDVDVALSAPRTPELEAIDAMTLQVPGGPPLR